MTELRLICFAESSSRVRAGLGVLCLGMAACAGYLAPAPRLALQAPLDTEFTLEKDETAWISGENLRVTFDEMKGDARCPQGAQCVQAGHASVEVRLHKSRRSPRMFTLSTPAPAEPRAAEYEGYVVELVSLEPVPSAGATRPPRYHAIFMVRRR